MFFFFVKTSHFIFSQPDAFGLCVQPKQRMNGAISPSGDQISEVSNHHPPDAED